MKKTDLCVIIPLRKRGVSMNEKLLLGMSEVEEKIIKEECFLQRRNRKLIEVTTSVGRVGINADIKGLIRGAVIVKPVQVGIELQYVDSLIGEKRKSFSPYFQTNNELGTSIFNAAFISNNMMNDATISYDEKVKILNTLRTALRENGTLIISDLNEEFTKQLPFARKEQWEENSCNVSLQNNRFGLTGEYHFIDIKKFVNVNGFNLEKVISIPPRYQDSLMKSASDFYICKRR